MNELNGSVAVVTGSARNIGRAIALALAEAGAAVVVNTKSSPEVAQEVVDDIEAKGGRAMVHVADVIEADGAAGLIEAAVSRFGGLDILVNNVARRSLSPIDEMSYDDWRSVLASILDSTFLCIRAAVPHLADSGRGSIVNIGGVAGHAGIVDRAHVAAGKAGIAGMTGALALELAPRGIIVNNVVPGYIDTPKASGVPPHIVTRPPPAGRPGEPREIAAMVRFLCGPDGRYITGQNIHINGGWHTPIG